MGSEFKERVSVLRNPFLKTLAVGEEHSAVVLSLTCHILSAM